MTSASQQSDHRDLTTGPIRVVVVEADPLVGASLRTVIDDSDDLQFVCEAAECGGIASQFTNAWPEVLVVDLDVLGDGRSRTLRGFAIDSQDCRS